VPPDSRERANLPGKSVRRVAGGARTGSLPEIAHIEFHHLAVGSCSSSTFPPALPYFSAFSIRLPNTCWMASLSQRTDSSLLSAI